MTTKRPRDRTLVPANTPWESDLCYSRCVRAGSFIAVSQTSAVGKDGTIQGGDDPYRQAVYALRNVESALKQVGAELPDVVRTRICLASLDDWKQVARAHAELFRDIRPAVSLMEVPMVDRRILVEFEVDAVA